MTDWGDRLLVFSMVLIAGAALVLAAAVFILAVGFVTQ